MVIQHNIPAINAHRNLGINNAKTAKNLEKLSSGYKINRAGDDAAGLAISEKMRGQIRGLAMAEQNANNGISLIQTAEGGLNETHDILQRMRELAVQSSNGTYQDEDRQQIEKEYQSLKSEIDRIASYTNYNGIKLLDGTTGGVRLANAEAPVAESPEMQQAYNDFITALQTDMADYKTWMETKTPAATPGALSDISNIENAQGFWGSGLTEGAKFTNVKTHVSVKSTDVGGASNGSDAIKELGFGAANAKPTLAAYSDTDGAGVEILAANTAANFTFEYNSDGSWTVETDVSGHIMKGTMAAGEGKVKLYADGETDGSNYLELDMGTVTQIDAENTKIDLDQGIRFEFDFQAASAVTAATTPTARTSGANNVFYDDTIDAGSTAKISGNIIDLTYKSLVPTDATATLEFTWEQGTGWTIGAEVTGTVGGVADSVLTDFTGGLVKYDSGDDSVYIYHKDSDGTDRKDAIRVQFKADTDPAAGDFFRNMEAKLIAEGTQELSFTIADVDVGTKTGGTVKSGLDATATQVTGSDEAEPPWATNKLMADGNEYLDKYQAGFDFMAAMQSGAKVEDFTLDKALSASASPDAVRAEKMMADMGVSHDSEFKLEGKAAEKFGNKDAYIVTRQTTTNPGVFGSAGTYETLLQIGDKTFRGTLGDDGTMTFMDADGETPVATLTNSDGAKGSGAIRFNIGDGTTAGALVGKENAIIGANGNSELVFQIGANGAEDQQVGMYVFNMSTNNLGNHGKGQFVSESSIVTRDQANLAVDTLDSAINYVSGQRADLGALQNRLEHTLNNLGVTKENLTAAESSIRDVDMAKEMMDFTKNNILVQAAQAMLAQANQLPQGVLQLLR